MEPFIFGPKFPMNSAVPRRSSARSARRSPYRHRGPYSSPRRPPGLVGPIRTEPQEIRVDVLDEETAQSGWEAAIRSSCLGLEPNGGAWGGPLSHCEQRVR